MEINIDNEVFHNDSEELKSFLYSHPVRLTLNKSWGATNSTFRQNIRTSLEKMAQSQNWVSLTPVQDLFQIPRFQNQFVSISHCDDLGGFASYSNPIGLDIENTSRMNEKLIQRILNPKDNVHYSNRNSVWGCKESSFKAIHLYLLSQTEPVLNKPMAISEMNLHFDSGNIFKATWNEFICEGIIIPLNQGIEVSIAVLK